MVLRRVVSAPAELALMAHTKKEKKIETYEQDALFGIMSETALDRGVTNPNEQFFCYLLVKHLTSPWEKDIGEIFKDVVARMFCSIISHHLMKLLLHLIHCNVFPSLSDTHF